MPKLTKAELSLLIRAAADDPAGTTLQRKDYTPAVALCRLGLADRITWFGAYNLRITDDGRKALAEARSAPIERASDA